jgi:hypothetical protein
MDQGFWVNSFRDSRTQITLTEGAKKAASILSTGRAAIGMPGVVGYRSKDDNGNKLYERHLLEPLAKFARPGRVIYMAFDSDPPWKKRTIYNVRRDLVRTAELLAAKGCDVRVLQWHYIDKGADDLIAHAGPHAYADAEKNAVSWEVLAKEHYGTLHKIYRKVARKEFPDTTPNQIEHAVWRIAIDRGDVKDGDRVLEYGAFGEVRAEREVGTERVGDLSLSQGVDARKGVKLH